MANNKIDVAGKLMGHATSAVTQEEKPTPTRKTNHTITVYLDDDTSHAIDIIATEANQITKAGYPNRHAIIQLAIKKLVEDYDKGYRPGITFAGKLKP